MAVILLFILFFTILGGLCFLSILYLKTIHKQHNEEISKILQPKKVDIIC